MAQIIRHNIEPINVVCVIYCNNVLCTFQRQQNYYQAINFDERGVKQWRTVGFWRPGQGPRFIFIHFPNVLRFPWPDVHPYNIFLHFCVYTHSYTNINYSLAKMCQMVGPFFLKYQVDYSPPKWRLGHVPLPPLNYATGVKVIVIKFPSSRLFLHLNNEQFLYNRRIKSSSVTFLVIQFLPGKHLIPISSRFSG